MAVTSDQPISVGNLAAYHESVWGGGSLLERRWQWVREAGF